MNGIRMRFETKPGKSFASAGVLAELARERERSAAGGLVRRLARRGSTSTSLQHRNRVEEVHADHPVGPLGSRRRATLIGIDDVFEARIALGRQRRVGAPEDLLLHVRVLDHGFDHEIGRRRDRPRPRCAPAPPPQEDRPSPRACPRLLRIASSARSRRARLRVVQRHAPPGCRNDLRDAAAHLPRADDEHVFEAHVSRA